MARDPASSSSGQGNSYLQRAYALSGPEATRDLYNEWAETYDGHLNGTDYASPERAVEALIANLRPGEKEITILDAGCGTGLVGECVAKSELSGRSTIDGNDLVDGMLTVARKKRIYRNLEVADLNARIEHDDDSYDVVTCVGTLTKGHVGPKVLSEFVRVTKPGGLIVGTVHDDIWESLGYKRQVDALASYNKVEIVSTNEFGIVRDSKEGGRMVVLRKL